MKTEPSLSHFTAELERWSRRPPEQPPGIARVRVLSTLVERPRGLPLKAFATAALLLGLTLGLSLLLRSSVEEPEVPVRPRQSAIVFQLQSGTKVYFALPPEGATKGDQP